MEDKDLQFLNSFTEKLSDTLVKQCTADGMLDGKMLMVEELNEKWRTSAPEYMVDAVKEIAAYPTVSLAWAAYLGMAIAYGWDADWEKFAKMPYSEFYGPRKFDDMDENILENILGLNLQSKEATKIEDVIRQCAEVALSQIRRSAIEPQSPMAFHTFARACKVLFRIGAAIELHRLGYKFERINLN